jgi:hypothetical protein
MLILRLLFYYQNVSTKVFAQVIKYLFIKNSPRRLKSESINDKKIPIKRNMLDILIEVVEFTIDEKLLEIKDVEKIKHNIDEINLFDLQEILKEEEESFDSDQY